MMNDYVIFLSNLVRKQGNLVSNAVIPNVVYTLILRARLYPTDGPVQPLSNRIYFKISLFRWTQIVDCKLYPIK